MAKPTAANRLTLRATRCITTQEGHSGLAQNPHHLEPGPLWRIAAALPTSRVFRSDIEAWHLAKRFVRLGRTKRARAGAFPFFM